MSDLVPIRRAIVSVYDKTGIEELAAGLHRHGVEIVSTGSTRARIQDSGTPVTYVADVTGFPECLDGRVKTLHPHIHAALLADRDNPDHRAQLDELGITPVDLVVVNLYPFEDAVAAGKPYHEIVEMIDIGGPTMLRAAAKNHNQVTVVVTPDDYGRVLEAMDRDGGLRWEQRRDLAAKAFDHVSRYDAAISNWFHEEEAYPSSLSITLERRQELRYGENPHQTAALYVDAASPGQGLGGLRQLHGKELSYNNLVDTDAAMAMAGDFADPCVAIIKHTNPAGLAVADDLETAYGKAREGDPVSAFGGIVAANRRVDAATARRIIEIFTEVVVAPGYDDEALGVLTTKKNLRVVEVDDFAPPHAMKSLRSLNGAMLIQDADVAEEPFDDWEVATVRKPDEQTMRDLRFTWIAAKHVKSNAIVLGRDGQVVGVGAGQMSRVDAVRLAVEKSRDRHEGSVLASDAFFPFRDGPDAAAEAGVRAIVQPGGSIRDDEVVAAADEHGIVMVMTGRRHFKH